METAVPEIEPRHLARGGADAKSQTVAAAPSRANFAITITDGKGKHDVTRTIILWAVVLAAGAFALQWLEYQSLVRAVSRDAYVAIVGVAFAAGGVWVGWKLSARASPGAFARNDQALASLGLTGQEIRVLEQLAAGQSNKEIARTLGLSPNTVKTHVANLYGKLGVQRRTQAVGLARELQLIP
jgi:NarL family two-component system response regulator LiaR